MDLGPSAPALCQQDQGLDRKDQVRFRNDPVIDQIGPARFRKDQATDQIDPVRFRKDQAIDQIDPVRFRKDRATDQIDRGHFQIDRGHFQSVLATDQIDPALFPRDLVVQAIDPVSGIDLVVQVIDQVSVIVRGHFPSGPAWATAKTGFPIACVRDLCPGVLAMDAPDMVVPVSDVPDTGRVGSIITTATIVAGITAAGTDHGVRLIAGAIGGTDIRF